MVSAVAASKCRQVASIFRRRATTVLGLSEFVPRRRRAADMDRGSILVRACSNYGRDRSTAFSYFDPGHVAFKVSIPQDDCKCALDFRTGKGLGLEFRQGMQ